MQTSKRFRTKRLKVTLCHANLLQLSTFTYDYYRFFGSTLIRKRYQLATFLYYETP